MSRPGQDALRAEAPLQQFWWLHDARWYQGVLKRFGQDAANEINAEAIKFVARRVAAWYRYRNRLDFNELPMAEFVKWFESIPEIMWTSDMYAVQLTTLGEDEWETVVSRNFALNMLRAARVLDGYECPCLSMRAGWFEGMGVIVRDRRVECMRTGGGCCRFRAVVDRAADDAAQGCNGRARGSDDENTGR